MSQRTDQVDSLLVSEVSQFLSKEFEPPIGALITVMRADVAPDLKRATIFVSILPENRTGSGLEALSRFTGRVQKHLNKKLIMKNVPKIQWELDPTTRKYAAIDEALKGQ